MLVVKARKCYWVKDQWSSSDRARLPSEPRTKQLVVWLKESLRQLGSESIGSSDLVNGGKELNFQDFSIFNYIFLIIDGSRAEKREKRVGCQLRKCPGVRD